MLATVQLLFKEDDMALPSTADRTTFEARIEALRVREKALTHEADAVAAERRRLPMVEVDATLTVAGENGPTTLLEMFEGRRQLLAYFYMWRAGKPAAEQCEGCTWDTSQMSELAYLHSRDVTYAVVAQGPYAESRRYRDFMGWTMPWYAAEGEVLDTLLVGRTVGMMHIVCYVRDGDRVFETYWTTRRGVEVLDNSYHLMDLTVFGRQEPWEDSPAGWPQEWADWLRVDGRPIPQWSRVRAGRSDDLTGAS
jgi:predicted dithiol-disulfide oxidoreductase (DUF899 family)